MRRSDLLQTLLGGVPIGIKRATGTIRVEGKQEACREPASLIDDRLIPSFVVGLKKHQEAAMKRSPFIGTWRLVSLEMRKPDGQVSYLLGRDAIGYIMYTEDGYMSVEIMSGDRPKFAAADLRGGTLEEKVAAADTYISYCGRYEVRDKRIIHHIAVSFFPNWIGQDQERFFEFDGKRLYLSTPPMLVDGVQQSAHIIWERITD
jgi:hypothetical protein